MSDDFEIEQEAQEAVPTSYASPASDEVRDRLAIIDSQLYTVGQLTKYAQLPDQLYDKLAEDLIKTTSGALAVIREMQNKLKKYDDEPKPRPDKEA